MNHHSITVIGSGAWGAWTAYLLQASGCKVRLVDRWGPGNSNSGSGGETRIIRTVYGSDKLYTQMASRSFELWHHYLSLWNARLYHEVGSIWLSPKGHSYANDAVKPVEEVGYTLGKLDNSQASQDYPQINFDGVDTIHFEPKCGYLEARNACRKVVTEFQKIGGNYLIDHVLKVEGSEKIEALLTQQNGRIISDLYVFACGPWIVKLFPELEKYIYTSRQEVYYFQDNLQLKVGQLPMWLEFQSNDEMYYGIPDHFNRGFKASYDSRNLIFDPDKDDRILTPELIDNMRDYLGYRFPMLKDSRLVEGRVCQYENSLDGDFIIDLLPDRSNGIILGGTSGHGYKMAPAIGEMVVNHLNKGAAFPQKFELDRFQHLSHKTTQFS